MGPNGASTSISYDGKGRPSSGVDANGMQVLYYYQAAAPQKKTTTNPGDKWVKEYYDGFGRTVKAETGSGATVVSTVETEYGPCACSPMGKVKRVSRPYAPGGSAQYWTTYSYDSLGRTVSVQQPPATAGGPSAGTTAYLYEGNTVKVTDPAGKWKKFTTNAAGELVEVEEPNSPSNFVTTYTYTVKGQLSTVTMPRPTGTQTRTFTYHASGAVATVTQPETGTTTNTVGTDVAANDYGMLKTKVDAKGQKVEYIYDAYKRVVEVKRYKVQSDTNPDACQGTKYQYDVNTWDVGFGATNLSGRMAGVEYHVCTYNTDGTLEKDRTIREMYSYSTGGRPLKKRMQLQRTDPLGGSGNGAPITGIANLDADYTWSAEGTLLTLKYPDMRTGHPNQQLAEKGNTITYQTDWLRRYSGMTEATALNPNSPVTLVSNMQYGISGELTSMTYNQPSQSSHPVVTETRQYNLLGQLTQITAVQGANTVTNLQYVFPTGTNNGRISSMVNLQSGETVTYLYDELNRLTRAQSPGIPGNPPSAWDERYEFDGFGNLTLKGAQSIGVLAASNRLTGPGISYDSNGNQTGMQVGTTNVTNTFDVENRLLEVSGQGFRYGFGPDNRKMWTRNASNGNEDYVFWGPQGKPIGTYRAAWEWTASSGTLWFNAVVSTRRWMGSKEISASSVLIHDRLFSVVGVSAGGAVSRYRYLPYGEPNTAGGSPVGSHFATYDRTDAAMYYADQRYYRDGVGRFLSADPFSGSAELSRPASLNRYAYSSGDPVTFNDPSGLITCGQIEVGGGATVGSIVQSNSELGRFIQFVWHEAGTFAQSGSNLRVWDAQAVLIAQAVVNRNAIANGNMAVLSGNGAVYGPFHGQLDYRMLGYNSHNSWRQRETLTDTMIRAAAGTGVLDSAGRLTNTAAGRAGDLQRTLNTELGDPTIQRPGRLPVNTTSGGTLWVTVECWGVINAMQTATSVYDGTLNVNEPGFVVTSWDTGFGQANYRAGIETRFGRIGNTVFYGFLAAEPVRWVEAGFYF